MKFLTFAVVFFLALGFSIKSTAEAPPTCSGQSSEECSVTNGNPHPTEQGEANSRESKISERMNTLFPEKQKNVEKVARPGIVKLVMPKFLSEINAPSAKLEWAPGDRATSYHLQVATDPNFKWLLVNEKYVNSTSFEVANLEPGQKYFWRVASFNQDNDSMYTKSLFVSSAFTTNAK